MNTTKHRCEASQVELNAWIDGEGEALVLPEVLDHSLGCVDCAAFWEGARTLQRGLPSPRIDHSRPRRIWKQMAPLGGALALAASLFLLVPTRTPEMGPTVLDHEVILGSGELDNAAALQLVVELLEASPQQRAAFRAALEAAEGRRPETAGELVRSSEGLQPSRRSLES